jgi:hypothetical protein
VLLGVAEAAGAKLAGGDALLSSSLHADRERRATAVTATAAAAVLIRIRPAWRTVGCAAAAVTHL